MQNLLICKIRLFGKSADMENPLICKIHLYVKSAYMQNPLIQNPLICKIGLYARTSLSKTICDGDCIEGYAFDLTLCNDLLENHKYF